MSGSLRGAIAFAIALTSGAGCGPSRETSERQSVMAGVERLRQIPAADTSARIAASDDLLRVETKTPEAKRARDACAKSYRLVAEATALTSGALAEMKDTSVRSDPKSLSERLKRAEDLNEQAEPALKECTEAMATLASKPER